MNQFEYAIIPEQKEILTKLNKKEIKTNITYYKNAEDLANKFDIDIKKIAPQFVLSFINHWKNKGLLPKDVVTKKGIPLERAILNVYKFYQERLKILNSCDFGDLILLCVAMFENNPDILELYLNNFKYILVDEYQDTNFIQSKWLNLLAKKNNNICCVGDDDQSIYSWRGAEIKNFLEFDQIYKNTKVIRLEENYRSSQNILSVASNLIANNQNRVGKTLITTMEEGDLVKLNCFKNGKDEAIGISDEIEKKNKKKKILLTKLQFLLGLFFKQENLKSVF